MKPNSNRFANLIYLFLYFFQFQNLNSNTSHQIRHHNNKCANNNNNNSNNNNNIGETTITKIEKPKLFKPYNSEE